MVARALVKTNKPFFFFLMQSIAERAKRITGWRRSPVGTSIPGGKRRELSGTDWGVGRVRRRGGRAARRPGPRPGPPTPAPLSPRPASGCAEPQERRPHGKATVPGPPAWIHLRSLNRGVRLGIQIITFSILTVGKTIGPKPEWQIVNKQRSQ